MTSRERVMAAFAHREPDRTPIWEKLIKSPVADELLGRPCASTNFHHRMERLAEGDWEGLIRQSAVDEIDLCELLGFDMVRLDIVGGPPGERPVRVDADTWRIGDSFQQRMSSGWVRYYFENPPPADPVAQEAAHREALMSPAPDPVPLADENLALLREGQRVIAERGLDLPIFCSAYSMGVATLPRYVLQWFVTDRDLIAEHYRRGAAAGLQRGQDLVAAGADLVGLGGDFACDHGPMCSPADYRTFIAPGIREQSRALHALGVYTSNASDGDLWPVIEDFLVTAEVDGFEEMDFAAGMDLARLKRAYPTKTFIGNIDIRHTLTSGTVEQVRAHTVQCIRDGWGNGGHILMSGNCIHESVKTELFLAHMNAYREYFGLDALDRN
jgi:hypothetical protein